VEDLARAAGVSTGKDDKSTLWTIMFSHDRVGRLVPFAELDDRGAVDASIVHDLLQKRPYLAVMRPISRSDGQAVDPSTMLGGSATWAVVIYDMRAPAPVCWTRFDVTSSETVIYTTTDGSSDESKRAAAQEAVERDLSAQVKERLLVVVPEMTKALRLPTNFKY
jgi:hypothetical protein